MLEIGVFLYSFFEALKRSTMNKKAKLYLYTTFINTARIRGTFPDSPVRERSDTKSDDERPIRREIFGSKSTASGKIDDER